MKARRAAAAVAGALLLVTPCLSVLGADPPPGILFFATKPGLRTIDQDAQGGNPFASALIEAISEANLTLDRFPAELTSLTIRNSRGFQSPDIPEKIEPATWTFQPKSVAESRVALIVVFSDYSSGGADSLPGAQYDARRVSVALKHVGFQTETIVDPNRAEFSKVLRDFSERSASADVAIVYTTGHGVEVNGTTYLLPGDYPVSDENRALDKKAFRVPEFASVPRGRLINFVFYAGCRDDPFGRP